MMRISSRGLEYGRSLIGSGLLICSIIGGGCARQEEIAYVIAEDTAALPELHQSQIRSAQNAYYGTPSNPTLRVPDFDAETEDGEVPLIDIEDVDQLKRGAVVYNRRCAGCHGYTGDGNGPAAEYLNPKPRDYRQGKFKFTSTPYGFKPRKADLVRTIRYGAKGTSMPAFPWLPDEDVAALVEYVIVLSHRGELERYLLREAEDYGPEEEIEAEIIQDYAATIHRQWEQAADKIVLPLTTEPRQTEETIEMGRQAFLSKGCSKCHGPNGRGQTEWLSPRFLAEQESLPEDQRIKINYDAWGNPGPAANIAAGMLHGGQRPVDIYRRIYSGINGTPMPAFSQALSSEPDTIWHLVHYVKAIQSGREFDNVEPPVEPPAATEQPTDEPKPEEPKDEQPKEEQPKDEPKPEEPKPEEPKPEEPKEEQPKDDPKPDKPKEEQPEDEPKPNGKKEEQSKEEPTSEGTDETDKSDAQPSATEEADDGQ